MKFHRKIFKNVVAIICILLMMLATTAPALADATFLHTVKRCHDYLVDNNFRYAQGNPLPLDREGNRYADCSSFVSWCIYEYTNGKFADKQTSSWFMKVAKKLSEGKTPELSEITSTWKVISDYNFFKPGDILCYNGHVHIYAGRNKEGEYLVYNAGTKEAMREYINVISESYFRKAKYALRLP